MSGTVYGFIIAFVLSLVLTPVGRRVVLFFRPCDNHSVVNEGTAPRLLLEGLGGLAALAAALLAAWVAAPALPLLPALSTGMLLSAIVGLISHLRPIKAPWELALLGVPAITAVVLWPTPWPLQSLLIPVFIAAVLFIASTVNQMENAGGPASLVSCIGAAAFGAMALYSGLFELSVAAFAVSGACFAFLLPTFRLIGGTAVSLGHTGTLAMGTGLAIILTHLLQHASGWPALAGALMPVAAVVVDIVPVFWARARQRAQLPGDMHEHISQRLHRAGIPRIEVAMWMGLVVLTASVAGIAAWSSPDTYFGLGAVILGAVIIGYLVFYSLRLQLPAEATPWHQEHTVCRIVTRLDVGGAAQHCIYLAEGMQKIGWRSYLIHGSIDPAQEESMEYLLEGRGIEAYVAPTMQREVQPIADIRALVSIYRVIRRIRPQIVDTHQAKAGTIGRLAAALCGVPIIVHTYHGISLRDYFGPLKNRFFFWIERICGAMSTALITVGPNDRDELVDIGVAPPGKFAAIPYGLPLRHLADASERRRGELRSELGIGAGELLVLYVGRLVPIKNTPAFIQMAAGVLERRRDVRFVMVGEGPMRPELEKQIAQLGIADKVTLYGVTNDMERIYADADLLVLCSRREGMPLTIMEALAARIPVVATQVGDVTNAVIQGVTGRLVPPGDTDSLTATVLTALEELRQSRDMARVGSEYVLRHFSLEALVDRTDALYRALIANHCYEDPHPFGQDLPEHAATGQR